MDYNNYYQSQAGPPQPPPPSMPNQQQQGCPPQIQIIPGASMMHSPAPSMNIGTPGPPPHQQVQPQPPPLGQPPPPPQQQAAQHISPHPMQNQPQPQPSPHHQNFFNAGPIPQTNMHHYPPQHHPPHHHHHHQPQPPQPQHLQHGPPPPHNHHQPPMMHHSPALETHPHPHHPQQHLQHPPSHNHHPHPQHHPHPHHPHPHPHHHPHQPPMMHHSPSLESNHPHMPAIGRNSPYYPSILQTELRVMELNRRLQLRPLTKHPASPLPTHPDESFWWERFASEFFDDDATLTLRIFEDKPVDYTIGRTLIPRFFRTYFDGGVTDLSINLRNPKETCMNPQLITLTCDQAFIITNNVLRGPHVPPTNQGVVVHTEGKLILDFVSNFDTLTIKSWKFYTKGCRESIDRSITTLGLPNTLLVEPVTRQGLTKSTIVYLKMCMIMEPMQDLMLHHRQTKIDPKSCLKHLLADKYKLKNIDDNRAQPNKRRKRRTPAATGGTKKSKAAANNTNALNNNTNMRFNNINNSLMSPSVGEAPNLSLASQDVMVVGEPSMLGTDFGDENERRITRLENNQFDASVNNNNSSNNNNMNQTMNQNQNQMCNNTSNQNPHLPNNIHHPPPMQSNIDSGGGGSSGMQMMNNNNSGNMGASENSNGNNYMPNTNNHQMNLIPMNGNHINHVVKSEMDQKPPISSTPTSNDSEAR